MGFEPTISVWVVPPSRMSFRCDKPLGESLIRLSDAGVEFDYKFESEPGSGISAPPNYLGCRQRLEHKVQQLGANLFVRYVNGVLVGLGARLGHGPQQGLHTIQQVRFHARRDQRTPLLL